MKMKKKYIFYVIVLMLFVLVVKVDSKAANYGSGYSFTLQAYGTIGGVSSNVSKNTTYGYATVYVTTNTQPNYTVHAFVNGAQRSWDKFFTGTGSFHINYQDSQATSGYRYGQSHHLEMYSSSSTPYATKISGSWTP